MKMLSLRFAVYIICLLSVCCAKAQTNTNIWQGTVNTDWATAGNWSKNAMPNVTDSVVIPIATNYPIISTSGTFSVKTITIDSSATLTVMGSITTVKGIFNKGDISGSGNIYGDVFNRSGSSLTPGGKNSIGKLTITGSLIDTLGSTLNIELAGVAGVGVVNGNDALYLFGYSYLQRNTTNISFIDGIGFTNIQSTPCRILFAADSATHPLGRTPLIGYLNSIRYPTGYNGYFGPQTLTYSPIYYDLYIYNLLPLKLLSFTAQQYNSNIALQWQTENEVNSSHFTIQRSVDGVNFINIGKVLTKGGGMYTYTDDLATIINELSPIYYRLQMVDKDGSFTYSTVVSCQMLAVNKQLSIFPNPVKDYLFVQLPFAKADKLVIQIADIHGKVLQQNVVALARGANSMPINIAALPKGSYTLLVKGENVLQTKQFVKE